VSRGERWRSRYVASLAARSRAESDGAGAACSEEFGDLRLGVLDDADRLLRELALAIVALPRAAPWRQGEGRYRVRGMGYLASLGS